MTREFPEEKFIASIRCIREDLAKHFATAMAKYFLEYRTKSSEVALDGCSVEISTEEFTDLLALLPFYRVEELLLELFRQIPEDAQEMYLEVLRASLNKRS